MSKTVHSVNLGFEDVEITIRHLTLPSEDAIEISVGDLKINVYGERELVEAQLDSFIKQAHIAIAESKLEEFRSQKSKRLHDELVEA